MKRLALAASLLPWLAACGPGTVQEAPLAEPKAPLAYPQTPRGDQVDEYFGVRIEDHYRWLEAMRAPEVKAWVEAQNEVSIAFLRELPAYERIRSRLEVLWRAESMTAPRVHAGRYFFEYNDGEATLSRLMVADGLEAEPRLVLDPALLSEKGTTLLARWNVSPDGALVAWAASDGGSDWTSWRVRDVETGEDLADFLTGTKFTGAAWLPDASGFYYARYPRNPDGEWDDLQQAEVWFHRLGTPQGEDRHVYSVTDHPTRIPFPVMSSDGRHLVLFILQDSRANGIYLLPLDEPGAAPIRLVDSWDGRAGYLGTIGDTIFINTSVGAARGRVVAVDLDEPAPSAWREVIPERESPIESASLIGETLIVHYLEHARSRVETFSTDGRPRGTVELPGIGKVSGFEGDPTKTETFARFESFTDPGRVLRYRPAEDQLELFHAAKSALDTDSLVTDQMFFESRDGTRVPMFLVHRKGLERDGSNPTLLYGYGGFKVSMLPAWDLRLLGWLDLGGVLAIANLRGGGEYGSEWHAAGTRERKQNVFDDFIAAAEWLIESGVSSPRKLAINGRSNGGLLVGAVMLQRPELFGATAPAVGVLDMLRYHTPSANARAWSGDYGLSENREDFEAQYAYSPVHNTKAESCYPPTLIQTAEQDDRVVPWHSYKFAAALQHAQGCTHPVLLRVETRAGHGSGGAKPRWMLVEEFAELYSFLAWALELDTN